MLSGAAALLARTATVSDAELDWLWQLDACASELGTPGYLRGRADDDLDLQRARLGLATTLTELGESAEAIGLMERVVKVYERAHPEDHPDLERARTNLAVAKHALGDLDGAIQTLEQVLAIQERSLPAGHPRMILTRVNLAANRSDAGHLERAGAWVTYELAFRMQTSVPEVMDITREPPAVLEAYGAQPGRTTFANNCLLARRLVENGVRFVQLYDWGWDIHGTGRHDDLLTQFPRKCRETDQPVAALVRDLAARGLLDETLVVWGGEFGRTSMNEARGGSTFLGRDHHPDCFTMWLAGGGVKAGMVYGETDELGYNVASDRMHVRDLQATLLHLLDLDAQALSYEFEGLRQRLIGPSGEARVNRAILA